MANLYAEDYRGLYEEWRQYFQDALRQSMSSVPGSITAPTPLPELRLLFSEFLLRRICQFTRQGVDLISDPSECSVEERRNANVLLEAYTKKRYFILDDFSYKNFENAVGIFTARYQLRRPNSDNRFLYLIAAAQCASKNAIQIPIVDLGFKLPATASPAEKENFSKLQIGCPFHGSLQERLVSGVMLYEDILSAATDRDLKIAKSDFKAFARYALDALDKCKLEGCQIAPAKLRCFSADFLISNLDKFQDPLRPSEQKIRHFFDLRIVGREIDDCDILVLPLPEKYRAKDGHEVSRLKELIDLLNRGTDAYAYSVTPKNLTENISTAAETRDALALLYRPAGNDIANLLHSRSEENRAVVSHPIVVGFGSPDPAHRFGIRDVDFGWIVAPRSREGGKFEQIDGQYALTAFISVPGWWQTAEISIATCWLSRTELASLKTGQGAARICPHESRLAPKPIVVKLPASVPEISAKLGFPASPWRRRAGLSARRPSA